jgi:hypothetical protein
MIISAKYPSYLTLNYENLYILEANSRFDLWAAFACSNIFICSISLINLSFLNSFDSNFNKVSS